MDILQRIAEQKIKEAIERGELDNLPLKGKRIRIEDLSGVPECLRVAYQILKNAGILPEEMQLKKEIISLQKLIEACYDDDEKNELTKKMNENMLRYNMIMEKNCHKPIYRKYQTMIHRKLKL